MSAITCEARIINIADWAVVHLPRQASQSLSSRGMLMIAGTLNGIPFTVPLEPDGRGSHWFRVEESLLKEGCLNIGDTVNLVFTQTDNWPEPILPSDLEEALKGADLYAETWQKISTKAKWEWIRWIRSPKNEATRHRRIEVALDKLKKGLKRPCCFNSAISSEPHVSRNGVLLDEA